MQANTRRDTKPELAVRRRLHAAGFRYRVDVAGVPGLRRRADIAFTKHRLAIFIDGCFWHGCPIHGPKKFNTNSDFWRAKINTNRQRDSDTTTQYEDAGWRVLRFWTHVPPDEVATTIIKTLGGLGV